MLCRVIKGNFGCRKGVLNAKFVQTCFVLFLTSRWTLLQNIDTRRSQKRRVRLIVYLVQIQVKSTWFLHVRPSLLLMLLCNSLVHLVGNRRFCQLCASAKHLLHMLVFLVGKRPLIGLFLRSHHAIIVRC